MRGLRVRPALVLAVDAKPGSGTSAITAVSDEAVSSAAETTELLLSPVAVCLRLLLIISSIGRTPDFERDSSGAPGTPVSISGCFSVFAIRIQFLEVKNNVKTPFCQLKFTRS
jgi:hypothetical protein